MFYRNPDKEYYATFRKVIANTLSRAFRTSEPELTRTYQELTTDEILEALRVKLVTTYPDVSVRGPLAGAIAKNFTLDCLSRMGVYARQQAQNIISSYVEQDRADAAQTWQRTFNKAKYEYGQLLPLLRGQVQPSQNKHLDAVNLLAFEGLPAEEVMEILDAPSMNTLQQWRSRGIKLILAHPETPVALNDVLVYMQWRTRQDENWPPKMPEQFYREYGHPVDQLRKNPDVDLQVARKKAAQGGSEELKHYYGMLWRIRRELAKDEAYRFDREGINDALKAYIDFLILRGELREDEREPAYKYMLREKFSWIFHPTPIDQIREAYPNHEAVCHGEDYPGHCCLQNLREVYDARSGEYVVQCRHCQDNLGGYFSQQSDSPSVWLDWVDGNSDSLQCALPPEPDDWDYF